MTEGPNINTYSPNAIREQLEQRQEAREQLATLPAQSLTDEQVKAAKMCKATINRHNDTMQHWVKRPLDVQCAPFPTWLGLLTKDPLQPTTRAVKRNLNIVWGTLAFGMFAYDFKWPPKIVVLGLDVHPGAGLMWALFALLAYHLVYFAYYLIADATDWFNARKELVNLLDISQKAITAGKANADAIPETWVKPSEKGLRRARWLFRTAYFRFALDFTVPIIFAIATGVALAMIGPPPKAPLCPCPTVNQR